jgi:hypothetical protein
LGGDVSSSEEKNKKLVISADDLTGSSGSGSAPADPAAAPTTELETNPTESVKIKAKKALPKMAPPPAQKGGARPPGPAPPASAPWYRQRRKLVFGAGLLAALMLAFVVSFVLLGVFDTDDDTAREALTSAASAFEASTADTQRAVQAPLPFTALSEVADDSADRASAIGQTVSDLTEKVDEERLVRPSVKALKAERKFLTRFSRIADFPESELGQKWRRLKPELTLSQQRIDASREAVLALNLGDTVHLMPANARMSTAIDSADRIILEANRKVQSWRAEREAAEAQLAGAEGYKGEMSGLMDEYYEQRNETQELVRQSHVDWLVAEETLRAHAAARQGIIESMDALSVPVEAESAHQQMVSLAIQSKTLLEEAADAARDEPYLIWTGTPGWQRLRSGSEAITQQFGSAESAVLGAAEQAIANESAKLSQVGPRPQL